MTRPKSLIPNSISDFVHELRPDAPLYRYCSVDELLCTLRQRLSLTCPFAWEDPFENPLFRAKLINRDGKPIDLWHHGHRLYCQCWSMAPESDAMWRLYGDGGKGVRIETTADQLLFQARHGYDIESNEAVYLKIGTVQYRSVEELRKEFTEEQDFLRRFMEPNCDGWYEALLFKREAFAAENEVRLIAHDFDNRFGDKTTKRLTIPTLTNEWINSIELGPRIGPELSNALEAAITARGIDSRKVRKSQLYGPLEYTIDLSGNDASDRMGGPVR